MRNDTDHPASGLPVAWLRPAAGALTVAALLSTVAVRAQSPQPPPAVAQPPAAKSPAPAAGKAQPSAVLPAARAVIDRHIEAIGGRKAVLGHSSTHASGAMSMPSSGVSGSVEVYAARPNKSLIRITLGGIGEVLEGFDGTVGWSLSAITGPMLTLGRELDQKKFDAAYDADLHDTARYKSMRTVEQTTFEGRPCYKVSLIHLDGTEDVEFYDVETRFRVATVATRESPMGPVKVTLSYSDYKKYGDLFVPTTMKQATMGVQQVLTFTSVEFDKVAPSVFEPPPAIKALIK